MDQISDASQRASPRRTYSGMDSDWVHVEGPPDWRPTIEIRDNSARRAANQPPNSPTFSEFLPEHPIQHSPAIPYDEPKYFSSNDSDSGDTEVAGPSNSSHTYPPPIIAVNNNFYLRSREVSREPSECHSLFSASYTPTISSINTSVRESESVARHLRQYSASPHPITEPSSSSNLDHLPSLRRQPVLGYFNRVGTWLSSTWEITRKQEFAYQVDWESSVPPNDYIPDINHVSSSQIEAPDDDSQTEIGK
ncbi:hypothetical protein BDN70DRAFT_928614 [Pholiota conissans]|uniref:Uncharacterized protein n=1 Tax=Pholiota conissans TaxID=109636 RepID=A0A9P6D5N9_9AGAR|nr:hypothetical protein BDN70DRAFT_928614 [Pholiota conissans]